MSFTLNLQSEKMGTWHIEKKNVPKKKDKMSPKSETTGPIFKIQKPQSLYFLALTVETGFIMVQAIFNFSWELLQWPFIPQPSLSLNILASEGAN